jgi:hypothetical protein
MTCRTHDCNEGRACLLRTSNGGEDVYTLVNANLHEQLYDQVSMQTPRYELPKLCKDSRRLFKIAKPSLFQRILKLLKVKP